MEQGQGSHPQGTAPHQAALNVLDTWQQQYAAQDTQNIPHETVLDAFSQWAGQASPGEQQQAAAAALAQFSPQQRTEIGNSILSVLHNNGLSPQAVGVHATNPSHISAADLTNLTNYAQQQNPDLLRQLLSNPLVGMLLSALLSYAIQRFLGGAGSAAGGTAPAQPPGGLGGGLGNIITTILGGAQQTAPGQGGLGNSITTLLGGGQQAAPGTQAAPGGGQAAPGGGGLDTLINQFLGGGQQATPGTQAAPGGGGGLGTIINEFLGGGQSSTANRDLGSAPSPANPLYETPQPPGPQPANPLYETPQPAPKDTGTGDTTADRAIDVARDPGSPHN